MKKELEGIRQNIEKINVGAVNLDQDISEASTFLNSIHSFIRNVNVYFWVSLIFMLILLLVIVLLEYKDLGFMTKIISLGLAIGSFLALIVAVIFGSATGKNFSGSNSLQLPQEIKDILNDFVSNLVSGVFTRAEIISGITLIVFVLIFIAAVILERNKIWLFDHKN